MNNLLKAIDAKTAEVQQSSQEFQDQMYYNIRNRRPPVSKDLKFVF